MSTRLPVRRGLGACAAAALLSVVMPGTGHWAVRARFRGSIITASVLNVAAMVAMLVIVSPARDRAGLTELIADRGRFVAMGLTLVVLAGTRVFTAIDAAWSARPPSGAVLKATAGLAATLVVAGGVAPLAVAADYVWHTDRAVERVFATDDAITAYPGATTRYATLPPSGSPGAGTTSVPTTTLGTAPVASDTVVTTPASTTTTTTTTLPPMVGEARVNVLLLGGDAGPDRWGLRTDSTIVMSIDPSTGDTVMISVPRNLARLPFPPGTALAERFPRGFNDLANALYPYVNQRRELAGGGADAGAQAVKLGMAQLLGLPIHYFVLVDMAGFVDVVDALGGIDLNVPQRVPSPGNPPGAKHPVPAWIEAGQQHMDGTLALTYARSRTGDSDYARMARQRCVLAAISTAASPAALATGLPTLVGAFGDAVRTDIPRNRLGEFGALLDRFSAAGGLSTVRTLHLAPPLVSARSWDALEVRLLVMHVIDPAAPPPDPVAAAPSAPPPVLATTCG